MENDYEQALAIVKNDMEHETLVVENADFDQLDELRLTLTSISRKSLTRQQAEALESIQNMFAVWSDDRANLVNILWAGTHER